MRKVFKDNMDLWSLMVAMDILDIYTQHFEMNSKLLFFQDTI